jgi:hypothetical protein
VREGIPLRRRERDEGFQIGCDSGGASHDTWRTT